MKKEAIYLYCVIETKVPATFGCLGIGDRGDELYTILFKDIAFVVSNSSKLDYPAYREYLIAHEKAIEEVMKKHTVLPVCFSTVTEDEKGIKRILEREYGKFKNLLEKMKNKKELGLVAVFKKETIYKDISKKYKDIQVLTKKISSLPPQKTYLQRMEIGKMVEVALQKEKEIYKKRFFNNLLPLAQDSRDNKVYGDIMIINAAFLVEKSKETLFDQKIRELADAFGEKVNFKYVGTIPPFNFVDLKII